MQAEVRMGGVCGTEATPGNEVLLGESHHLQEGQMKEYEVQGNKLLLVRQNDKVMGLSAKCTHYGAPLIKGALGDGVITCAWHGACFSTETGDIEDFPGCSSLISYKILEENGNLYVDKPKDLDLSVTKKERFVGARLKEEDEHVVIVGAGAAAHTAIETMRSNNYKGQITLIGGEKHLPYDRPVLSKTMDKKPEDMSLRSREWYSEAGVHLKLDTLVTKVLPTEKQVVLHTGQNITYHKLLYCTGGTPRQLGVEGEQLAGVHTLRTPQDAHAIHAEANGKKVVIVGGSFIGMEVSSVLVKLADSVTVVDRNTTSFQSTLGSQVGAILQDLHKTNGVQFEMEAEIDKISGDDEGRVCSVTLKSGKSLQADVVIIAVGVLPATQPFSHIPHFLTPRGIVEVDEFMKTKDENIWAAGDVVQFPLLTYDRETVNIGHWGLAMYMGMIAALSIMDKPKPAFTVPFFWTVQYGKSIRFAGMSAGCEEINIDSDETGFLAVYSKEGIVQAVCTLGRDPIAAQFKTLMMKQEKLKLDDAIPTLKSYLPK